MTTDPSCENFLSISGTPDDLLAFHNRVKSFHDTTLGLEVPAIFASHLPCPDGLSQDEKIGWCGDNWGTLWPDAMDVPVTMLGDRETEQYPHNVDPVYFINKKNRVEYTFVTFDGPPKGGVVNLSKKYPALQFVLSWDDHVMSNLGAVRYVAGDLIHETKMFGENYPKMNPVRSSDVDTFISTFDEWQDRRMKMLHACIQRTLLIPDSEGFNDEPYERPVSATGVPSEHNHGEFIIAEIQNGKCSATIVTVPNAALTNYVEEPIEVFPTVSKYRVVVGVSVDWYDRLIAGSQNWDEDDMEMEVNDNDALTAAVNLIMSEAMVRVSNYFRAKGLIN